MDEIIYIELNNWMAWKDYPDIEPVISWIDERKFSNDKWCKENELCVVNGLIDMSENWCIAAPREWVRQNMPDLLEDKEYTYFIIRHSASGDERFEHVAHSSDYLRQPDEYGDVYGRFGWLFPEYCEENLGVRWTDEED